jgi:hypothetical protein
MPPNIKSDVVKRLLLAIEKTGIANLNLGIRSMVSGDRVAVRVRPWH